MLSFVARLALSAVLATSFAQAYTINTPTNVVVCLPALLAWDGGVAPYFLSILPAGQPTAAALVDLGEQSGTSVTWTANLGVGVSAFLNLRDSTGTLAQSGEFTIRTGNNITCVGKDAVTSAGGSSASGSSTSSTKATGSSSSASASASATPSTAAAVSQYAPVGFAAILGAAVLALTA